MTTSESITLAEAQRLVLERAARLELERVPIERAYGRVLGEPARAAVDLPPFASSAVDGYAVRAEDAAASGATLAVVGTAAAGRPAQTTLTAGQAVEISTGGVVPDGADAVVPLEEARVVDGRVELLRSVGSGKNVRPKGGDAAAGAILLEGGARLGGAEVGALAAAGIGEVRCAKRPRVGILVTGSELRPPGEPLAPGQIYESNGLMLAALLTSAGAVPAQLGIVVDDVDEHRKTMERALLGFDMLVTTGGASVGPHDLVRRVQSELRVDEVFWRVAIKPGRPVGFGVRRDHLVFNLPGNPVSALVCFELFVRPAVEALLGISDPRPRFERGPLAAAWPRDETREQFVRARRMLVDGERVLEPIAGQESHMIVAAAHADALVHIPRGDGDVAAGARVDFLALA